MRKSNGPDGVVSSNTSDSSCLLLTAPSGGESLSLGRSETLEFVTGQIRQPTALLGKEIDAFSHF